jgi:hypothetical protein
MGQFASKEYDGDPYIDLMRALPERELIWWVQKAIWVSAEAVGAQSPLRRARRLCGVCSAVGRCRAVCVRVCGHRARACIPWLPLTSVLPLVTVVPHLPTRAATTNTPPAC